MTSYLNPKFGDDATAQPGSRARPWKTFEAAEAALKELQKNAAKDETFKLVLTHKRPPPPAESVEVEPPTVEIPREEIPAND